MIAFIAALVVLAAVLEYITLSRALDGIGYSCSPSALLVEPDEQFELVTTLTNESRRLVPFIKLEEAMPEGTAVHTQGAVLRDDYQNGIKHLSTVYMTPRSRLERRLTVSLPQRGRYTLSGAELRGGDFLGLRENMLQYKASGEIIVCPREADTGEIAELLGGFLGDVSVRRFIMEDPVLTVGSREYTGREPMKAISWPHSVRTGRLMVKQYDYTLEPTACVMLDVECSAHVEGYTELIERCYSITRTICRELEVRGIKYDFMTNAYCGGSFDQKLQIKGMDYSFMGSDRIGGSENPWYYIGEGLGHRHFTTILEGLGRAAYGYVEPLEAMISRATAQHDGYRSTVIITPMETAAVRTLTARLRAHTGAGVSLIPAGNPAFETEGVV